VRERQATEEKLQNVLRAITQEKGDLEVLVQIPSKRVTALPKKAQRPGSMA
jgi:hypothetical protein